MAKNRRAEHKLEEAIYRRVLVLTRERCVVPLERCLFILHPEHPRNLNLWFNLKRTDKPFFNSLTINTPLSAYLRAKKL